MIFSYLAVERIPKELRPGVVYHNADFELGLTEGLHSTYFASDLHGVSAGSAKMQSVRLLRPAPLEPLGNV